MAKKTKKRKVTPAQKKKKSMKKTKAPAKKIQKKKAPVKRGTVKRASRVKSLIKKREREEARILKTPAKKSKGIKAEIKIIDRKTTKAIKDSFEANVQEEANWLRGLSFELNAEIKKLRELRCNKKLSLSRSQVAWVKEREESVYRQLDIIDSLIRDLTRRI